MAFWMESMILVAGLAIAGLAGIAAAFYFSVRPGRSQGATRADRFSRSRGRNSRPSSAAAARSSGPARSASARNRRAAGHARTEPAAGFGSAADFGAAAGLREDPGSLVADRRTAQASTRPTRRASTGPTPAPRPEARNGRRADAERFADAGRGAVATRPADEDAQPADEPSRSRRRVGRRKGADVEEEMWPLEAFGGVSDEQFWDDLAADKTLATTARTADPGPRSAAPRPRSADRRPRRQPAETYQLPGPGAADQTMVQPAALHAVPPVPGTAALPPVATQPYPTVTQPPPTATQPVRAATQPVRAARQTAEPRGHRSAEAVGGFSADEDPLTSPAYSLRAKGAVDGHSYLPSHRSREPYRPDGYQADPLRSDGYRTGSPAFSVTNGTSPYPSAAASGGGPGGTAGYPYLEQPYGQATSAPVAPSANTPPYGDVYGYRNPTGPTGPTVGPRHANASRGLGRPGGNGTGDGTWGSRQAYPPVNGYRSPHDPREPGRRLTTTR
jgi:hypothetical protein